MICSVTAAASGIAVPAGRVAVGGEVRRRGEVVGRVEPGRQGGDVRR